VSFPKQKKPRSWRVLQDRIRHYADQEELPQSRVRRAVSFMLVALPLDRSLDEEGDPLFLVKGGVSMELRLKMRARTTKDLDTVYRGTFEHWLGSLDEALGDDIDDFSYSRDEPTRIRGTNTFRVNVAIDFKGKRWGKVQLEIAPSPGLWIGDPVGLGVQAVAEALEMLVEVQDVDARVLSGDSDSQVRKRKAVSAVRALSRQLAHRRQYGSLDAAIHGNLTKAVERPLDRGNSIDASRVDHQLVAHGPAPADIASLDRLQQQIACIDILAGLHPGGGICQHRAAAVPDSD
jgi:Nucleotidyl transferase AbiEii toxin, Type IV TA system